MEPEGGLTDIQGLPDMVIPGPDCGVNPHSKEVVIPNNSL